jgi:hypothetical protein
MQAGAPLTHFVEFASFGRSLPVWWLMRGNGDDLHRGMMEARGCGNDRG